MGDSVSEAAPPTVTYSKRFQDAGAASAYDLKEYGSDSYSSQIWRLQRPIVERLVRDFMIQQRGPVSLLDFACGTGRLLSCLEVLVDSAEGVDISPQMIELARGKCKTARLVVGDITAHPELLGKGYDIITAFRFLLNVEPEIRLRALKRLREVLNPGGMLLVNMHGNSRSLRHPAIVWKRRGERSKPANMMLNEMSPQQTRTLLGECGFKVERQFGFGFLPPTLYRTPLRRLAYVVDRALAGDNSLRNWSIDLLFVCRAGGHV